MSIEYLNEDLSAVAQTDDPALTALVLSLLESDLNVIQKLDDEPNDVGGLTAAELKAKFDEAGNVIKKYINETLIPAVSDTVAEAQMRAAAEAQRVENENIRVSNENQRVGKESERLAAEGERLAAEQTRVTNENARVSAESARKSAETARAAAETAREDKESGYVAQAKYWAEQAKEAADGDFAPATHAAQHKTGGSDPLTAADVGAAPAGFGLGTDAKLLTGADDLNTLRQTGWYKYAPTSPPQNVPFADSPYLGLYGLVHVIGYQYNACVQIVYNMYNVAHDNISAMRTIDGGDIGAWEYINPPMTLNTEYRTTERIAGKAVYKKNDGGVIKYRLDGETEWKPYAQAVGALATDGSNTMTGSLAFADRKKLIIADDISFMLYNSTDDQNAVRLELRTAQYAPNGLRYVTWKDGVRSDNIVLHQGNLAANNIGQIVTGSYVGTGTYGEENPNSLTFDRPPKFLAICDSKGVPIFKETTQVTQKYMGMTAALTTEYQEDAWAELNDNSDIWAHVSCFAKCSEDRKTISWYASGFEAESDSADAAQCNVSGVTYRYFAIC